MAGRPYALLDVFTATPLAGNPLAVVLEADDLDAATQHAFARETRLSETSFVQAGDGEADYRHRIWTMQAEIPFAGHPSLGTAVAVAAHRGDGEARYVQRTRAGLQPVDVRREDDRWAASMLQESGALLDEVDPAEALVLAGLPPDAGDPGLPPQWVSTGVPQLVLPVRPEALARVRPDFAAIDRALDPRGGVVLYVAACDPAAGRARARSFMRTAEMGEDPATGAGAGPLGAYLHARTGAPAVTVTQGVEMGRPSELRVRMEGDRPRVEGDVVLLAEGRIHL